MTVSDILYIVSTVAVTQGICDLAANKFIFSTENYTDRLSTLERMRTKRDKALALPPPQSSSSNSSVKAMAKYTKKIEQVEQDFSVAASNVAQKHISPKVYSSLIFFFLYKILNTEYHGKVIAVLPYEPWGIIRRFSMRGIEFSDDFMLDSSSARISSPNQACGFLFIYMLCTISVKFAVNKILVNKPPTGADKGFMTMMDDPRGQKILQSLGVDTDEINEFRKNL